MRRLILLVLIAVGGAWALWSFLGSSHGMTIHSATAYPTGAGGTYMIGLTIDNTGAPEVLDRVTSPGSDLAMVMGGDGALIIPGGGTASFAMDGAHLMVRGTEDGGFVPLTLHFASGAALSTRAKVADGMMMDHGLENGVEISPAPTLKIALDGTTLTMQVTNFTLKRVQDTAEHVAGEGHAHVYLNNLKLGRLYDTAMEIGTLPAGTLTLRVSLNTHDHRPYLADGAPIHQTLTVEIP